MLHKTKAIILRTVKYSETSVIAKTYTEQFGMQSYMVNGVRTSKSGSKKALLQPGTLLDLVVYHKPGKDLQRISEVKPWMTYRAIPFDVVKGSISLFIIELLYRSVREEESNEGLFRLAAKSLASLDEAEGSVANIHLWFMIQLTNYLGFLPHGDWTGEDCIFDMEEGCFTTTASGINCMDGKIASRLSVLLQASIEQQASIEMNRDQRNELLDKLIDYYRLHLDHFHKVKSPAILQAVIA
jgi:DNA repair protein RecO (recombination protein O)